MSMKKERKARDISNEKIEEMVADPAIRGIFESFDLEGMSVEESDTSDQDERKAKIKERIKNKIQKRRNLQEDEDEDEEFTAEDFDDEDFEGGEIDVDFDEEEFDDTMEMEDPETAEMDPVDAALDQAQSALDDLESHLGEEGEFDDEEIDFEDEDFEGDVDIDDVEDAFDEADEPELEESQKKDMRNRIKEAIRRKMKERKGGDRNHRRIKEALRRKIKEHKGGGRNRRVKEALRRKIRERKGGGRTKKLKESYMKLRKQKQAINTRLGYLKEKYQKGAKAELPKKTGERILDESKRYMKSLNENKRVPRSKLKEAYRKALSNRMRKLIVEKGKLNARMRRIKEELYSTGGPAPGQQVEFPKAPKKTQTGIQKQKGTEKKFPKGAKKTQKGNLWPTHGSASDKKGEAVKKAGKFPGKDISRQK